MEAVALCGFLVLVVACWESGALRRQARLQNEPDPMMELPVDGEPLPPIGPCPFCGKHGARLLTYPLACWVRCQSCGATGPVNQARLPPKLRHRQAVIRWNIGVYRKGE